MNWDGNKLTTDKFVFEIKDNPLDYGFYNYTVLMDGKVLISHTPTIIPLSYLKRFIELFADGYLFNDSASRDKEKHRECCFLWKAFAAIDIVSHPGHDIPRGVSVSELMNNNNSGGS